MQKLFFTLIFLCISNLFYSQDYLKLKMGIKRSRLLAGNTVGLTFENDTLNFNHWNSISQAKNDTCLSNSLWMIQKIEHEKLTIYPVNLSENQWILDTIYNKDIKDEMYYSPNYRFQGEYYSSGNELDNFIIVKIPSPSNFKTVSLDSVTTLTFAENYKYIKFSFLTTIISTSSIIMGSILIFNSEKKDVETKMIGSVFATGGVYTFYNALKSFRKNKTRTFILSKTKIEEKKVQKLIFPKTHINHPNG